MESSQYVTIHGLNITHSPRSVSDMSIDRLLPALLECFGIILCGYVAGRSKIISMEHSRSLGSFVSCFALPALLFKNMVQLEFADVEWSFLWSVLIAKVAVFMLVCVLTLLVASPECRFGKAGLFAIFSTQSNDFALGYPIVEALYHTSHPGYVQYLYLVAPVSLMLLNPVGFALCEYQRCRQSSANNRSKLHMVWIVLLRVFRNPIVFMVLVGIGCHFLFGGRVPLLLGEFVDALAASFGGTALFYLGLMMVGQSRVVTRSTGVTLILLITAKLLMMPLLCKDMLELLDADRFSSVNHSSLSDYTFLYGVFPTAPSVAIYASQYNMQLEVVTSGMVLSTLLSAPIMYLSAWLLSIPWMEATHLVSALQEVSCNISIISFIVLVWTVSVMVLSRKFKTLPHMFTTNLFIAQLLVSFSMSIWKFVVHQENELEQILIFTLLYGSLYSTYLWTGLLALSLALMKINKQLKLRPGIFIILGWGLPFLIVGLLLVTNGRLSDTTDASYYCGKWQMVSSVVVLTCSIILGGVSLIGLSHGAQREQLYQVLEQNSVLGTAEDGSSPTHPENHVSISGTQPGQDEQISTTEPDHQNDSGAPPQGGGPCEASGVLQEETQVTRHFLLCLLLVIGLLANLSSCLWWLFNVNPGRLYLELQLLCAVANYGQGIISFGLFGLDEHLIISPIKQRFAAMWGGGLEENSTPSADHEEIHLTCTQFVRYHKNQCVQDIIQRRGRSAESLSGSVGETLL